MWIAFAVLGGATPAPGQLVISPTFDSSITGNANALAIENAINTSIGVYESLFTDNITISILYRYSNTAPNGGPLISGALAQSNSTQYSRFYNSYISALAADTSKSANDVTAIANLPAASAFPNNPTRVDVSSANGRSVGFFNTPGVMSADGSVGVGGTLDGIVTLNSGANLNFTRPVGNSGKFDALALIEHETDEVLGFGSILPNTLDGTSNAAIRPQDLFRYSAPHGLSLSASGAVSSYFSIDGGVTSIVAYNQNSGGDYGDWGSNATPLVQLAFVNPNTQSDVTQNSPEGITMDVIGYNLSSVPEPGSLALVGGGAAVLFGYRRRGQTTSHQFASRPGGTLL
jgi:hypothetical protein